MTAKAARRKNVTDLVCAIDNVRARIAKLKQERQAVVEALVPKAVALQRLDDYIETERSRYKSGILDAFVSREPSPVQPFIAYQVSSGTVHFGRVVQAMIWHSPQNVRAALARELDAHYAGRLALADDERDEKLAELDEQLFEAEIEDETLICQAEALGIRGRERRADADPKAIVAAC